MVSIVFEGGARYCDLRITQPASFPGFTAPVGFVFGVHLRCAVQESTAKGLEKGFLLDNLGQPKVGQFNSQRVEGRNQDVVWLDITVGDLASVEVLQCV